MVALTNLQRQILHTDSRVGEPKTDSAKETLVALNPDIEVVTHNDRVHSSNVDELFEGYDVIVDGCDNFPTRYLVNDACCKHGIPNVHGSIYRFEGQATVCRARLRPDGFVSLDGGNAGCVTSKPFVWKGEELYVNVDARWGELYAEIVDMNMRPVPGFWVPAETPPPLRGDHTRARIEWKPDHDRVFDEPVRVRFYLHQARLYSFWLEAG